MRRAERESNFFCQAFDTTDACGWRGRDMKLDGARSYTTAGDASGRFVGGEDPFDAVCLLGEAGFGMAC